MLTPDMRKVLIQRPLGLVFDIDGTLSPIAPTPGEAKLHEKVAPLLEQAREYAHIAIITGRAIEDGAKMVNVDGLTYIGTHGLELSYGLPLSSVEVMPESLRYGEPGKYLLKLAEENLSGLDGIFVEYKRIGGSIHYRNNPNPEKARKMIWALLEVPAQERDMYLSDGKRVVEIKPRLKLNKGEALKNFVDHFGLKGVVFAGDDVTDHDAVKEIARLKQKRIAARSIVVSHHDTSPELVEDADEVVDEVDGMVKLLEEIVDFLIKSSSLIDSSS